MNAIVPADIPVEVMSLLGCDDLDSLELVVMEAPQVDCPITHHFGPGVYIREIFIPAGAFVIGHSHKNDSMNVMLKGKAAVRIGGAVSIVEAPFMTIATPGRKALYAIEDTVWQNIHATEETDLDKLEAQFVEPTPAWREWRERIGAAS